MSPTSCRLLYPAISKTIKYISSKKHVNQKTAVLMFFSHMGYFYPPKTAKAAKNAAKTAEPVLNPV
jgi:lantibiotic modifying enzyme